MNNSNETGGTELAARSSPAQLTVFLVSSIRTSSQPWEALLNSNALRDASVVFVRIVIGYGSYMELGSAVEHLRRAIESHNFRSTECAIVAWGLGGVVVKKYLARHDGAHRLHGLKTVIFIGTPGRPVQRLFGRSGLLGRVLHFLLPTLGSADLQGFDPDELGSEWESYVRTTRIRVVYIVGSYDSVAPFSASEQWDSRNVFVIPETHVSLITGKAEANPESPASRIVAGILLENA